ncbi:response regulator transcription factor [uncultured Piscinibacter sp.]|uniref:response regulator n=1 Tax=uncultured Piscinibacter sp. TaxID=1131835 RepID=UPI002614E4E6|nr:response regulator transcription factor [uncultured Piscinibacter sp.]
MAISVLIVEDEPEFLRRFSEAVLADGRLRLLGAVSSGAAGLALLDAQPPDVMLVDLGLPDMDGVELIRHAVRRHPGCDVLVVTMFGDDRHVMASIEAGATGYLLKDASIERIAAGIHELHAGGSPISPGIARRVLQRFRVAPVPPTQPAPAAPSLLSERETEILRLVAKGFSFDTVGEVLGISSHTVVTHVKKIYRKLAVHSRGEAVYEASQMGLL